MNYSWISVTVKFAKQAQQFGFSFRFFVRRLLDHVFLARVREMVERFLQSRQRKWFCRCYSDCNVPCTCRLIRVCRRSLHTIWKQHLMKHCNVRQLVPCRDRYEQFLSVCWWRFLHLQESFLHVPLKSPRLLWKWRVTQWVGGDGVE